MNKFGLYSKMKSQAGQRDALVAVLLDAAAVLQQVSGCLLYIVNVSASEPDTLWVTEVWSSQADHAASLTRDDVKSILVRGRPLIAGFERIEIEPIGERVSALTLSSNCYVSGGRGGTSGCAPSFSCSHFALPRSIEAAS